MQMRHLRRIGTSLGLAACLSLSNGCARPQTADAGLIIGGGRILTLGEPESVEAIAVGGGRILAMGDRAKVEKFRSPNTVDYDLEGRVLAPAFVDHHVHLLNLGLALLYRAEPSPTFVDLAGLTSLESIGETVGARARALPPGTWILGQSWSQGAWGATELPTHEVLSAAAPDHPVFLTRGDGHAGWANTSALRAAGIDAATPDPPGGVIRRTADRSPSGVLLERAAELLRPLLPEPSPTEIRRAFRLAAETLSAQGVTEVFDAGFLGAPGIVDLSLDFEQYLTHLVETALDVFEEILGEQPQLSPERLRIEHFSYARPSDFGRTAGLGIVAVVNPDFVAPDDHGLAMEDARVGLENSERVYALGRLAAAGARLAFGSDYFAAPGEPLLGFYGATTRSNGDGLPADGWHPGERLSRAESLRIQTRLWPPGGGPPERGGLTVGGRADLVVLTADPLAVDASAILGIGVETTLLDGAITHGAFTDEVPSGM